jgi:hypothetical protein
MKKRQFVSEQIKAISKRSGLPVLVAELIRQVEKSEQSSQRRSVSLQSDRQQTSEFEKIFRYLFVSDFQRS